MVKSENTDDSCGSSFVTSASGHTREAWERISPIFSGARQSLHQRRALSSQDMCDVPEKIPENFPDYIKAECKSLSHICHSISDVSIKMKLLQLLNGLQDVGKVEVTEIELFEQAALTSSSLLESLRRRARSIPLRSRSSLVKRELVNFHPRSPNEESETESIGGVLQTLSGKCIDLARLKLGSGKIKSIASGMSNNKSLQSVQLALNELEDAGIQCIADELLMSSTLLHLDLTSNRISNPGAAALARALKINHTLQSLNLSNNRIKDPGALDIASSLKVNCELKTLNLEWNQIRDKGGIALAKATRVNPTLQDLILTKNQIGATAGIAFAQMIIQTTSLKSLMLGNNRFGDKGVVAISHALTTNRSIQTLSLKMNQVRGQGFACIAESLECNSLLSLDMSSNQPSAKEIEILANFIRRSSGLQHLDLSATFLDQQSVELLADALRGSTTLLKLDLIYSRVGSHAIQLVQALKFNRTLKYLDLTSNTIGDKEIMEMAQNFVIDEPHADYSRDLEIQLKGNEASQKTIADIGRMNCWGHLLFA